MLMCSIRRQGAHALEGGVGGVAPVSPSGTPTQPFSMGPQVGRKSVARSALSKPPVRAAPPGSCPLLSSPGETASQGICDGSLPHVWVSQLSLIEGSSPEARDRLAITPNCPAPAASLARRGGGEGDKETFTSGYAFDGGWRGCRGEATSFPSL